MSLLGNIDDMFEKSLKKFNDYNDVDRIDELVNLLKGLRKNQHFIDFYNLAKEDLNQEGSNWRFDESKIPFINAAKKGFGFNSPIYLPPLTKVIDYTSFIAMYSIIQLSYIYHSGHKLYDDEYKSIILGNIGFKVTHFIENYDKEGELPEPSIDFFKKLSSFKWSDKRAKNLEKLIYQDYVENISTENWGLEKGRISGNFMRSMGFCSLYLMGCNALKNNQNVITCEDVVVAYLTTFKLMFNDVRPLVPILD